MKEKKFGKNTIQPLKNIKSKLIESKNFCPKNIKINYHMYFLICKNFRIRTRILNELNKTWYFFLLFITYHYINQKLVLGSLKKKLNVTEKLSKKIIRLPLWIGMNQNMIIKKLKKVLND